MVIYAGQGDPRRVLELLWGRPARDNPDRTGARPGPKPSLDVDAIVRTGIAVADADGLPGLSMRTVGERLGRTAMALYTHVPGKDELVDLMYDRVHAELDDDYDLAAGWRPAAEAWAEDLWAFYLRHPWVLQVSYARPVLGPHEHRVLEAIARILEATDLPAQTRQRLIGVLFHFLRGAAQTVAESRSAAKVTGTSDQDWWSMRAGLLADLAPDFAERFPATSRMAQSSGPPPQAGDSGYLEGPGRETFAVGLQVILDGIEAAEATRASPSHR